MFVEFNIWVKDEQNESLQTCLNPHVWRRAPSFQKNSVCAELFPQSELPSANRQPSSDVLVSSPSLFVLLLLLLWLLTGNIPRKTSGDWLLLCFRAADRVCVLLAAAVLQPLGTEGGRPGWELNRRWGLPGKKEKDNGWARIPQNKVVEGGQRFQTPPRHSPSVLAAKTSFPSFLWPPTK